MPATTSSSPGMPTNSNCVARPERGSSSGNESSLPPVPPEPEDPDDPDEPDDPPLPLPLDVDVGTGVAAVPPVPTVTTELPLAEQLIISFGLTSLLTMLESPAVWFS